MWKWRIGVKIPNISIQKQNAPKKDKHGDAITYRAGEAAGPENSESWIIVPLECFAYHSPWKHHTLALLTTITEVIASYSKSFLNG